MNGEIGRRRAESVRVITGVIGETSGAYVDKYGNQSALECPTNIRELGEHVHFDRKVTFGRRDVARPELLEQVFAALEHLAVPFAQVTVGGLRHRAIDIASTKKPLIEVVAGSV